MREKECIKFANVSFSYGKNKVLEDISFSMPEGAFMALMGPNGGGKSTLLKMMLGLLQPDQGSVKVLGKTPPSANPMIGYLAQDNRFDPSFPIDVFDTVLMGRYRALARPYGPQDRKQAMDALKKVQMEHCYRNHIRELSGGQLQRVLIARAIVKNPRLLLLDEPMSGVDAEAQRSLYALLSKLHKEMAIVMITHDTSVVSEHVHHIACLNRILYYHGPSEGSLGKLAQAYRCPVEVISHGIPHRVLGEHQDD